MSPTVPGGGQPKATREALCPACLPDCCPQRPPLVTRPRSPSTPPDATGCPLPLDSCAALLPLPPFPIRLPALAPSPSPSPLRPAPPPPPRRTRRRQPVDSRGARSAADNPWTPEAHDPPPPRWIGLRFGDTGR
ncbi:hypothetical protein PR202_ga25212 [Eleusine coracana subsp. coracana]|uniref:Uncharacterized protein n=1 Tax=Eleusine coracana subsp. coracana TaxID=191504 RepID=A0AAV5DAT5_ELECO|nr:hypothetical protein PR202_ga25212 [Eleusine coracana subsp. coracana]